MRDANGISVPLPRQDGTTRASCPRPGWPHQNSHFRALSATTTADFEYTHWGDTNSSGAGQYRSPRVVHCRAVHAIGSPNPRSQVQFIPALGRARPAGARRGYSHGATRMARVVRRHCASLQLMKASIWGSSRPVRSLSPGCRCGRGNRCSPPWGEMLGAELSVRLGGCLAGWPGPGGVRGARRSRPAGVGGGGRWGALRLVAAALHRDRGVGRFT